MKTTSSKLIVWFAFNLAAVLAFAAPFAPINPADYPAPIRVSCVGDSITQGVGAELGKAYPAQLQGILGDKWLVTNFGVGGTTLLKKGNHPYWETKEFQAAQDFKPDVVVIMLGTNDTKRQNWEYYENFYADYTEMVGIFKTLESKPRVFICLPCPVPEPGNYKINEKNLAVELPLITTIAAKENVGLIDVHSAMVNQPALFPDRVHPNTAGAAVLAQTVAAALTGKTPN